MIFRSARWPGRLAAGLLALSLGLGAAVAQAADGRAPRAAPQAEDPDNARVIVKYRSGSTLAADAAGPPRHAARLGRQLALASMQDGHVLGRRTQSLRARGLSSSQLAARLSALPEVEWAVPARRKTVTAVLPDDPYFADGQTRITPAVGQWYLRAPDATQVSAVNAVGAWAISTGSAALTVAVLDTGVVKGHPDLAGKLYAGYDFVSRTATSNDGNGRDADASDPGDWSTAADSCGAAPSSWHGTQVAGLIGAASDNGIGMTGLGRNLMVLPVRVLGRCGGYDDDIIAAMRWAAGASNLPVANPNPARVINLSLGSSGSCSSAYQDVINEITAAPYRTAVVVAAGNDTGHAVNEPANCSGVIAVAGVRHAGTKVGYSNIGPEVAIAAPAGNCVNETGPCLYPLLTTTNASKTSPGAATYSDSFTATLGTSFAAPLVAGTVGLMLSVDPTLTPTQVKLALQGTARRFPKVGAQANGTPACMAPNGLDQVECYCTTTTCGAGLLDVGAAVARIAGTSIVPTAVFASSADAPTVGTSVTFDAGPSSTSAASYRWDIEAGADLASFTSNTGDSATLVTHASGKVVASLMIFDSAGRSHSTSQVFMPTLLPTAVLSVATPYPTVGATVALDASASPASTGRSISSYQWTLSFPGAATARFATSTNASTAKIAATAAGDVTVNLSVVDNVGDSRGASQTLTIGAAPVAAIRASNAEPAAGSRVLLDGRTSAAAVGHGIRSYRWVIASGAAFASFDGPTDDSTATLVAAAPGTVSIELTVTDDAGATSIATQDITVAAVPVVVSAPSGGGGGGGALGWGWIAGLAAAVLVLAGSAPGAAASHRR